MYCRKCGKKLFDDDRFCSACGTKVLEETSFVNVDEEVVYNNALSQGKKPIQFQWKPENQDTNKYEEQAAKQAEKLGQEYEVSLDRKIKRKKDETEFVWNLHDFSNLKPKKTEEIEFNWKNEEIALKRQPLIKEIEEVKEISTFPEEFSNQDIADDSLFGNDKQNIELENEILKDCAIDKAERQVDKIDMFYTFNKKNEEFQQLLDREYDKIRKGRQANQENFKGQYESMSSESTNCQTLGFSLKTEEDAPQKSDEQAFSQIVVQEEKENKILTENQIPTESQILSENQILTESQIPSENEIQIENQRQEENQVESEKLGQVENEIQLENLEQLENPVLLENELEIKDNLLKNEEILKKFDTVELKKDILEIDEEETFSRTDALDSLFGPKINVISQVNKEPVDIESEKAENFVPSFKLKQENIDEIDQDNLTKQILNRADSQQEKFTNVSLHDKQNVVNPQASPPSGKEIYKEGSQTRIFRNDASNNNNRSIYNNDEYDEPKGKNLIWKIILGIIICLVVIEGAILAIKIFAPNSGLSTFLTEKFSSSYQWILGEDGEKKAENVDSNQLLPVTTDSALNTENQNGESEVSTKPATDKVALITCQLGNNKNIKEIKSNSQLSYNPTKDYGFEDINKSQPLQNNLWYQNPDGSPVYYDHSIVGSLIAFDSMWIDYVNNNDKSVIELTKEGEMAYKNAVSFGTKTGKFEETFESLEIGEIRVTEKGFCVWAHEKIKIEEKGKTTSKEYNWVYYLEPVEKQMKIVSYYAF